MPNWGYGGALPRPSLARVVKLGCTMRTDVADADGQMTQL